MTLSLEIMLDCEESSVSSSKAEFSEIDGGSEYPESYNSSTYYLIKMYLWNLH